MVELTKKNISKKIPRNVQTKRTASDTYSGSRLNFSIYNLSLKSGDYTPFYSISKLPPGCPPFAHAWERNKGEFNGRRKMSTREFQRSIERSTDQFLKQFQGRRGIVKLSLFDFSSPSSYLKMIPIKSHSQASRNIEINRWMMVQREETKISPRRKNCW